MTVIYLIRHAQVENPKRLLYGHLPGFGLSEEGVRQARSLARKLKGQGVVAIYASPLQRARETALLIQAGLRPKPSLTIREKLRENEVTRLWQGVPYFRIPFRFPRQYLAWAHHPERITFSENTVELAKRLDEIIREISHHHEGETVVAVSHATPIRAWAFWRLHRSWRTFHAGRVKNARGYRIELDGERPSKITPF